MRTICWPFPPAGRPWPQEWAQEPCPTNGSLPPFPRPSLATGLCRVLATGFHPRLGGRGALPSWPASWAPLPAPVALHTGKGWADTLLIPGSREPRPSEILSSGLQVTPTCPASISHFPLHPIQSLGAGGPVPDRAPQLCRKRPSLPWVLVPWGRRGPRVARRETPAGLEGTASGEETPGPETGEGPAAGVRNAPPSPLSSPSGLELPRGTAPRCQSHAQYSARTLFPARGGHGGGQLNMPPLWAGQGLPTPSCWH